eukprot:scaffold52961_cov67-Phaeocystis_antarctica.AAC.2
MTITLPTRGFLTPRARPPRARRVDVVLVASALCSSGLWPLLVVAARRPRPAARSPARPAEPRTAAYKHGHAATPPRARSDLLNPCRPRHLKP